MKKMLLPDSKMNKEVFFMETNGHWREIVVLLFLFFELNSLVAHSQTKPDTLKLPFAIADEKRLSDEDIKDKKDGAYVTGTPDFSSDPVNGFGYGGEGSIYFDGKR